MLVIQISCATKKWENLKFSGSSSDNRGHRLGGYEGEGSCGLSGK